MNSKSTKKSFPADFFNSAEQRSSNILLPSISRDHKTLQGLDKNTRPEQKIYRQRRRLKQTASCRELPRVLQKNRFSVASGLFPPVNQRKLSGETFNEMLRFHSNDMEITFNPAHAYRI